MTRWCWLKSVLILTASLGGIRICEAADVNAAVLEYLITLLETSTAGVSPKCLRDISNYVESVATREPWALKSESFIVLFLQVHAMCRNRVLFLLHWRDKRCNITLRSINTRLLEVIQTMPMLEAASSPTHARCGGQANRPGAVSWSTYN